MNGKPTLVSKFVAVIFVFTCTVILSSGALAQNTIFSENMGNVDVASPTSVATYNGFQNYGVASFSGTGDIRATQPSNGSGGNNAFLTTNGSSFTVSNININGATNIVLKFGLFKSTIAENGSTLTISVSVDGGTPITINPSLPTGNGTAVWQTVTPTLSIPAGSKMSITFTNTGAINFFRIDDLILTSTTPLPVNFGIIKAIQQEGVLAINWATLAERNSSHFDVEVSNDGLQFHKIATIKSKAVNGNSDVIMQYEMSMPVKEIGLFFILPILIASLNIGGLKRKSLIGLLLLVALLASNTMLSCTKKTTAFISSNDKKIFIRIKQVDLDGKYQYSRVVEVVNI